MRNEKDALHLDVLSAIPGRIRVLFEMPVPNEALLARIPGVLESRYNPRIRTLTCRYDSGVISEEQLIIRIGAIYVSQAKTSLLHVKRCEEEGWVRVRTDAAESYVMESYLSAE